MPAPYTDTQKDTLIDGLIADLAALTARVADLQMRVDEIESASVPAVSTLQDDVSNLKRDSRRTQEGGPNQLGKPQIVQRDAIQRVRRPDGKIVQRIVKPR